MKKLMKFIILYFFILISPYLLNSCGMEDPMPCFDNCEENQEEEEEGENNG